MTGAVAAPDVMAGVVDAATAPGIMACELGEVATTMANILKGSPPNERPGLMLFCRTCVRISVWSLTMHGNGPIGLKNWESTQICIPLLIVGSL